MEKRIRETELNVIFETCRVIGQALKLDQALDTILAILSSSLAMKRATITLEDEDTGYLIIRASHGLTDAERRRGVYRKDEGITGLIFQSADSYVVPDISKEPLFLNKTRSRLIQKESISFLGVPILLHGKAIGVLHVDRLFGDEVPFEEDIRLLSIVATLIAQFVSLNRQVKLREAKLLRDCSPSGKKGIEAGDRFFMVGRSPSMLVVQRHIEKVAPSKASVLLLGESGTGKTLVAQMLHELSIRSSAPFVKINCASLPENLLESELFGYEKGAFTGAVRSKPGRIEEAEGGTVFLDEVGELTPALQAKLLRFLQDKEFERLGSTRTRVVDVRVLAATNRDLAAVVAEGTFREDLYYRLNVFPIQIPPLRARKEDIPDLLHHFLDRISREYGRRIGITNAAMALLAGYDWPGNVREMENLVERMVIMADEDEIGVNVLPPFLSEQMTGSGGETLSRIEKMERKEILAALERNGWNQTRTAKELGITLRQIGYRVRKFGLDRLLMHQRRGG
ncbi:sigma-54-dependent Fis family transcriptional regulator [Syntrophobacter fumaroxidans]|uniref:Transcriptional regulator, NifA subfamily, Fis Family n=1 Tax=Syntrophobacter fumaroxidans (strain DSM 10017 / MPOB) TaxID=335543 RepID=A0LH02_SYNFM|nr:sigma-54-dependent Fis family transcriptional regulator [Syntrophobacter fumaroxidans]ABK16704.1 transcriptional regulator, NifA subfamily, Fis Family [Syntrophobacter fumaroxidans MPOB]